MAQLVIALGITPADYAALTLGERDAIVRELNKRRRR
jgi:hypothetical protein